MEPNLNLIQLKDAFVQQIKNSGLLELYNIPLTEEDEIYVPTDPDYEDMSVSIDWLPENNKRLSISIYPDGEKEIVGPMLVYAGTINGNRFSGSEHFDINGILSESIKEKLIEMYQNDPML